MREQFVHVCVLARNDALSVAIARTVEASTGLILETTSDDPDAVIGACSEVEAVLLAEARLLLDSRDIDDLAPSLATIPTILLYEQVEEPLIRNALAVGAHGVLHREAITARLGEAIRRVRDGGIYLDTPALRLLIDAGVGGRLSELEGLRSRYDTLSAREREIFVRLARGLPPRAIARELGVSPKTVETHQAHIQRKLDASGPVELFHIAMRLGFEEVDEG